MLSKMSSIFLLTALFGKSKLNSFQQLLPRSRNLENLSTFLKILHISRKMVQETLKIFTEIRDLQRFIRFLDLGILYIVSAVERWLNLKIFRATISCWTFENYQNGSNKKISVNYPNWVKITDMPLRNVIHQGRKIAPFWVSSWLYQHGFCADFPFNVL